MTWPASDAAARTASTSPSADPAARATCDALAGLLGVASDQILPFSTGVILEPLPVDRIVAGLPAAITLWASDALRE